jgi:hypothetical protein
LNRAGNMNVKVQIVIESEAGEESIIQDVAQFQRDALGPEILGLTLFEAKTILQGVQQALVEQQVADYLAQQAVCPDCSRARACKERRSIVYRTLFGKLHLQGNRLLHCPCQAQATKSFSPLSDLLPERSSPELLYLESKFASLMSYGLSVKLLEELLPIGSTLNAGSVRRNLYQVAQRLEAELGEEQAVFLEGCLDAWAKLPRPDLPLTVGIDGGYVHSSEQTSRQDGWFEVIVGKSITAAGKSKVFGLVPIRKLELLSLQWLHKLDESSLDSSLVSFPTESITVEIDSSTNVLALLPIASLGNSECHVSSSFAHPSVECVPHIPTLSLSLVPHRSHILCLNTNSSLALHLDLAAQSVVTLTLPQSSSCRVGLPPQSPLQSEYHSRQSKHSVSSLICLGQWGSLR